MHSDIMFVQFNFAWAYDKKLRVRILQTESYAWKYLAESHNAVFFF